MNRFRVAVLATLLLAGAVPAAIAQGPANPECPRWRADFTGMPVRMVSMN